MALEEQRMLYGEYPAYVTDNRDEERRGRVQVVCPMLHLDEPLTSWLEPSDIGAGAGRGQYWPPEIGDIVWITFDRGDPSFPLKYTGGTRHTDDVPLPLAPEKDHTPYKRGWISRAGHKFIFDDKPGEESIRIIQDSQVRNDAMSAETPATLGKPASVILKKGSIDIRSKDGSYVELNGKGQVRVYNRSPGEDAKSSEIVMRDGAVQFTVKDCCVLLTPNGQLTISTHGGIAITSGGGVAIDAPTVTLASKPAFGDHQSAIYGDTFMAELMNLLAGLDATFQGLASAAASAAPLAATIIGGGGSVVAFLGGVVGTCQSASASITAFTRQASTYVSSKTRIG